MRQLKVLFLVSFLSVSSFGANPTPAQVDQAGSCFDQLIACGLDGKRYVNAAKPMLLTGTVIVFGSTTPVTVPQAVIDEIVGKYQDKKQACVNAYLTCP